MQTYNRSGGDVTAPTGTATLDITGVDACKPTQAQADGAFDASYAVAGYTDNCSGGVTAVLTSAVVSGTNCGWKVVF